MRERRFLLLSAVVLVAIGCGPDVPEFDPLPVDAGRECGTAFDGGGGGCGDGQVCLAGRCYEGCESDQQCASTESCVDGICTTGGSRTDAGADMGTDAGPCTGVMCDAPSVCHPNAGSCVQCIDGDACGAAEPICDFAYGSCETFRDGILCAPCNIDRDCPGFATGETCVDTGIEQVCLAACDATTPCPGGLRCDGSRGHCVPTLGSCTQLRNAIDRAPCTGDTDCVPLGTTPAPGTCDPTSMQCLYACADGFTCPGGFFCDDPVNGFCRPR